MDLALNNLQRLICHKTQPTKQTKVFRVSLIKNSSLLSVTNSTTGGCPRGEWLQRWTAES